MGSELDPIDPREIRISDQDREQVAVRLQQASAEGRLSLDELDERLQAVYAARTFGDLQPITRDLPAVGNLPAVGDASPEPIGEGLEPTSQMAVAVMGGFTRKGSWIVPRNFQCLVFCGGGQIDLRHARFAERATTIRIFALMGGVEVIVPPEAHVHVNGLGIMGGWDQPSDGPSTPGGPSITVTGLAIMGGVNVARKSRDEE